jgi:Ca2+-binding RTX toxin-like protein
LQPSAHQFPKRRLPNRQLVFGGLIFALLLGLAALFAADGIGAAPPCAGPQATNAHITRSADGSTVYGSECSDRIVVTSPAVEEIVGGKGADLIYANPDVVVVDGGEGDDMIYGELPEGVVESQPPVALRGDDLQLGREPLASASISEKKCEANVSCYGGIGSQKLVGSSGNDWIFGQRGNDELFGNSGNDQLFGGIGDEGTISGGAGNDLLAGGMGKDYLNGNQENDMLRADGTTDHIEDTSGNDTLSFASAATPGFNGTVSTTGFPADSPSEERGVAVYLDGGICAESNGIKFQACNNDARYGGGYDEVVVAGIENVIGSPFADLIIGSSGENRIDGGGGTDVVFGRSGNDALYGGPDGDFLSGEEGTDVIDGQGGADNCAEAGTSCAGSSEAVVQRDRSKISVGFMATNLNGASMNWSEVFMSGSTSADRVKAAFSVVSEVEAVTFTTEGESAKFDTSAESSGCAYEATKVVCVLPKPIDAITVSGNAGNDVLTLEPFDETTFPAVLGGEGNDELVIGSGTEDMLVDGYGSGADVLKGGPKDDVLINNEGADNVQGGAGNDLLISANLCEGDTLQGAAPGEGDGTAQNSSSWAKLVGGSVGVVADLAAGKAGTSLSGSTPVCAAGTSATLANIDDLEGSDRADQLYGDEFDNNLLGRPGKDELWGREGVDNIEAKEGVNGGTPEVDKGGGGPGTDTCTVDAIDSIASCP